MTDLDSVLRASGWFPGRRTDASASLDALWADGYTTWPELEALVAEWDGLEVQANGVSVELDAARAAGVTEPTYREIYETHAGCPLAPIGIYSGMTIMLGRDGSFYGVFDDLFGRLDGDLPAVIDEIVSGRPGEPLRSLPEIVEAE